MFADRHDAGTQLASRLARYTDSKPVVLGLPRGGVPVAAEVAKRLRAPLDVVVVRKLGCPWHPELGIGALAEGGVRVVNDGLVEDLGISLDQVETATSRELAELERRVQRYRSDRPPIAVEGRVVIIVDDGLATGYTAWAAIDALRRRGAARVILAVPVASEERVTAMRRHADAVFVVDTPPWLYSISEFYADFRQTSDAEVVAVLDEAAARGRREAAPAKRPATSRAALARRGSRPDASPSGGSRLSTGAPRKEGHERIAATDR